MEKEEYFKKIYTLLIVVIVITGFNLLLTFINLFSTKDTSSTISNDSTTNQTSQNSDYDVSDFNTLNLSGVLDLFEKDGTSVLYLGRSTCSACVSFLPTVKAVQEKYGYVTNYLDITTVSTGSSDYKKFQELLEVEVTENINGEEVTADIGEFFGYTPMVIIIKDGKAVDCSVGAYSESKFEEFLNENGIK